MNVPPPPPEHPLRPARGAHRSCRRQVPRGSNTRCGGSPGAHRSRRRHASCGSNTRSAQPEEAHDSRRHAPRGSNIRSAQPEEAHADLRVAAPPRRPFRHHKVCATRPGCAERMFRQPQAGPARRSNSAPPPRVHSPRALHRSDVRDVPPPPRRRTAPPRASPTLASGSTHAPLSPRGSRLMPACPGRLEHTLRAARGDSRRLSGHRAHRVRHVPTSPGLRGPGRAARSACSANRRKARRAARTDAPAPARPLRPRAPPPPPPRAAASVIPGLPDPRVALVGSPVRGAQGQHRQQRQPDAGERVEAVEQDQLRPQDQAPAEASTAKPADAHTESSRVRVSGDRLVEFSCPPSMAWHCGASAGRPAQMPAGLVELDLLPAAGCCWPGCWVRTWSPSWSPGP